MNLSLYEIILSRTDNSRRRLISGHAAACNIRFDVAPTEYPVVHNSFSSFRIAQISFLVYFSSDTILPYTSPVVNRHFPQLIRSQFVHYDDIFGGYREFFATKKTPSSRRKRRTGAPKITQTTAKPILSLVFVEKYYCF